MSLLGRLVGEGATRPATPRVAIIDIGSNSVRLVVYQGQPRVPAVLFNEKVMAGLGRGLAATGSIDAAAMALARQSLARFAAVVREMEVETVRTVATAAVRDAANGQELIAAATALGLKVEILTGEQEAVGAGLGVLSGIPDADGIVGDLGGGSLELVRVRAGAVEKRVSFPLGVLRIAGIRGKALDSKVSRLIADAGWTGQGAGLPFYLVGGSWRALARLDMAQSGYPLPIAHQYCLSPETIARLGRSVSHLTKAKLRTVPGLSSGRASTLADAGALLGVLIRRLGSRTTIVSAYGLREGLLYGALDEQTRALDPLIVAAREEGRILGRFPEHGDLLDRWIAPLFADQPARLARIRHAACLLADVGWRANPEFRAERGLEIALHGNWVAMEAAERAMLAQALFTSLGGGTAIPDPLQRLAGAEALRQAVIWGLAIRLGQRLSSGLAGPLARSSLSLSGDAVTLTLADADRPLYAETTERRHVALAGIMNRAAILG
ncbi:Ppx/GppA family phosphatase [Sphingomonas sp. KR1UV-12]|uniref:Ppx/GppA family phosphatase n=1 Tax=Sphingomonas aurea TaxID=3063994 RepID=A0ABT9EGQ8_9SPHN|nr:Ppx/GppA family phosphatase [Sphingomonas sp. KR1UV-12]MDP1026160.1 Ppx/GppA family phosphatase [Sphingomonas sp. KR1UV-12]